VNNHIIMSIKDMAGKLTSIRRTPKMMWHAHVWNEWYNSSFALCLQSNADQLEAAGIGSELVVQEIVGAKDPHDPRTRRQVKSELQKRTGKRIKRLEQPDPVDRIRNNLHRWMDKDRPFPSSKSIGYKLAGPPLHVARRVHRHMQLLPNLVAPKVCAAVFRTVFNGWCTERRFQRRWKATNKCVLGCGGQAEDSIEHYCCCPTVQDTLRSQLRVIVNSGSALAFFMMAELPGDLESSLMSSALMTYAMYMATNHYRNCGTTTYAIGRDFLRQTLIQATRGHSKSRFFLDSRWTT
jgi:hypothetical protein